LEHLIALLDDHQIRYGVIGGQGAYAHFQAIATA
jgi:hypothetical protein